MYALLKSGFYVEIVHCIHVIWYFIGIRYCT